MMILNPGSVSILPTVLFLTTGVIREMAPKDAGSIPSCVPTALQCLKALCTSKYLQVDACHDDWINMLRSALATVLDYAREGGLCIMIERFRS